MITVTHQSFLFKLNPLTLYITGILLLVIPTLVNADASRGQSLAQTCLGCHGAPGLRNPSPVYSIPVIGGQKADYIVAALKAYKNKTRSHPTMQAQSANLTEQDMKDIADFFASVKGSTLQTKVNKELAMKGKALITADRDGKTALVCVSCHGQSGDNNDSTLSTTPKLAGQYQSYLEQALKDYRSGSKQNPLMAAQAKSLTIEQIQALSTWFSSQSGDLAAPKTVIFK